jgi:drug/metabolite transporter (DMT)-like permease
MSRSAAADRSTDHRADRDTDGHTDRDTDRRTERHAHAALLLMVLIWGINFPVAKAALTELPPLAFNALRFPLAAVTLLVALHWRGGLRWPERGDRLRVLGLGLLGNLVYQQFFIFGLDHTRAGNASILLAGTPILTALLSAGSGHERLAARTWIGVCATFLGIALVVAFGGDAEGGAGVGRGTAGGATLLGDALMIGASCAWALYTVGSRNLVAKYGAVAFTAWTLLIGAVALGLVGLPAVLRTDLGAVSVGAWTAVVYAGALSIGVAYLIWYYSVGRIGNTRTATYSNLVPVVALAAAWLQLGEVPLPGQLLGAAVVLAGITIAQRSRAV